MDPASSDIRTFQDGKGSLSDRLEISFKPCAYLGKGNRNCLSFDDYNYWFKDHTIIMKTFIVSKFIDFSEKNHYMKD